VLLLRVKERKKRKEKSWGRMREESELKVYRSLLLLQISVKSVFAD
jgi:hypothetical protein